MRGPFLEARGELERAAADDRAVADGARGLGDEAGRRLAALERR